MIVRYTRAAAADFDAACAYIVRDRPAAAHDVGQRTRDAVTRLADYPEMGRAGRIPGTRELVVPRLPYVVAHRVRGEAVEVLAIFHGAQRWPSAFRCLHADCRGSLTLPGETWREEATASELAPRRG